ncbi:murein hydrolase activator EnvC family protein [Solitalea lacus]|uniref:murein hydrolase activator EnvC family protein n=1 Tax=Solitalea lacus TaxID=2911172 RepID=UPI001EDB0D28|nr:M23 family metallopeptidase [Solitalea lacus]UKJ07337.1 M23 family metallopeptidase [Solitalea lacus]
MQKRRKLLEQLKIKYKLVVLNDDTFEEQISLTLNLLNVFVAVGLSAILLIILSTLLVVFTPLKEYIPGYADVSLKKNVTEAAIRADSLEHLFRANEVYLSNIKNVINGKVDNRVADSVTHLSKSIVDLDKKYPAEVEELRNQFEEEEKKYSVAKNKRSLADLDLTAPVQGEIAIKYDLLANKPFQVIETADKAPVKSICDGLVLFSGLTVDAGYVIVVQHDANVVSVYKQCSGTTKKSGNYVKTGETIAVTGKKDKSANGSLLAFELWSNGVSVDPNEYFKF